MNRNGGVLVAGIFKREHVARFRSGKHQRLLGGVGEELDVFQRRMIGIEGGVIHRGSRFDDGDGVRRDVINLFSDIYFDVVAIALFRIDDILHRVADGFRLMGIIEGDLISGGSQGQRLAAFVRTIASHSNRLLGDFLTHHEIRVVHSLVGSKMRGIIILVHVMDDIAQDIPRPMRVDGGIRRDLRVPVEQVAPVRGGIPAVESVAFLGRTGFRCGDLLILFDFRYRMIDCRGIVPIHKCDRKGGRSPLGVEHYVAGGHGAKGIGCG